MITLRLDLTSKAAAAGPLILATIAVLGDIYHGLSIRDVVVLFAIGGHH